MVTQADLVKTERGLHAKAFGSTSLGYGQENPESTPGWDISSPLGVNTSPRVHPVSYRISYVHLFATGNAAGA
jgi:hypothetical protein